MEQNQSKTPVINQGQKKSDWLKNKLFEQKKFSQIKQVQFHGSRHRG